jgi:hypothetical protein
VELDEEPEPPQPASEMVRAKVAARTHAWVEKRNCWDIFSLRLRNPLGLVPCSFEHDLRNWMRAQWNLLAGGSISVLRNLAGYENHRDVIRISRLPLGTNAEYRG